MVSQGCLVILTDMIFHWEHYHQFLFWMAAFLSLTHGILLMGKNNLNLLTFCIAAIRCQQAISLNSLDSGTDYFQMEQSRHLPLMTIFTHLLTRSNSAMSSGSR